MTAAEDLVAQLTLDEKAGLTTGYDLWTTVANERLGIPSWGLTDGPAGARGSLELMSPTLNVPCAIALGATWNPELVERVGEALGDQTRIKGCRVLLAPTVNLHRSPLGGRTFESFSEDPLLSGRLAAGYVRGVQSRGVIASVKHFAGNEAEFERFFISSVIDERTLRELYLVPFELAVRDGGALAVMTAYNRLNGVYCTESPDLLEAILRLDWGFEGFVLTDWGGIHSTVASAEAGLDLAMPGPPTDYGPRLAEAVRAGELKESVLDAMVGRFLGAFEKVGALDDPLRPPAEGSADRPEHRALARDAAAEAMVLLRNDGVLPFDVSKLRTLAVIGPNASRPRILGGGSAALEPYHWTSPLDAIVRRLDGVEVTFAQGCEIDDTVPPVVVSLEEVVFGEDGTEIHRRPLDSTKVVHFGSGEFGRRWTSVTTGTFTSDVDGPLQFTLSQAGRARVLIDGVVVVDGTIDPPPPGRTFFGYGSAWIDGVAEFRAGVPVELRIELSNETAPLLTGAIVGLRPVQPDDHFERAVVLAGVADAVVVVVGTTDAMESEGFDRTTMKLPGEQDDLVRAVCAANPRTVVVLNTGSPVELPWSDKAAAVLSMWFGGQEMADALVDVLTGDSDPSGRLPVTFPERLEHSPAYGNFPGEQGEVRYGEGLLMGYRWYDTRHLPVRFPFGHGLSYTTFELGEPDMTEGLPVTVRVPVTNIGSRPGFEVVQLYVEPVQPRVIRPRKELKAFAKLRLEPQQSKVVTLTLDRRAFAYWQPDIASYASVKARSARRLMAMTHGEHEAAPEAGWRVDPGLYRLHVGRSSIDIAHVIDVNIA